MISDGRLAGFALISLALIVVPGPNVLFVVSRSLMLGRGAGVATAAGGQIGASLQVAAVAFGVGELVERSAAVFTVIKLAGAASGPATPGPSRRPAPRSCRRPAR